MNSTTILTLLLGLASAHGDQLTVDKATKFFSAQKMCKLAIAQVYPHVSQSDPYFINMRLNKASEGDIITSNSGPNSSADIFCVFNGTKNEGNINESKACVAGYYNPGTDAYAPLLKTYEFFIEGKPCTKETVTQLLKSDSSVRDFKSSPAGVYFQGHLGRVHNVYETFLRAAAVGGLRPDLKVLYDEFGIKDQICGGPPCDKVNLGREIANIKKTPEEIAEEKRSQEEQAKREIAEAAALKAETAKENARKAKAEQERKKKEDLWK